MSEVFETDLAGLFHRHSSNYRSRSSEWRVDEDRRPRRFRTWPGATRFPLPGRDFDLTAPMGEVLRERRSVREFVLRPLDPALLGRLLHVSYGVRGRRTVEGRSVFDRPSPSAGGLYPLELYVALQQVESLPDGLFHYDPRAHELELLRTGLFHPQLAEMTIGQDMIRAANVVVVITAIFHRTMWKYGQRGYRYVWLDAGHVGQNLYLAATAMDLGPVTIGGFFDAEIDRLLGLPPGEHSIYLACLGQP